MLEKGFLKSQPNKNGRNRNFTTILSNTLLYLGVLILIISLVYLVVNLGQSDRLAMLILPFLVAGLGLIIISQFIKRAYHKLRR